MSVHQALLEHLKAQHAFPVFVTGAGISIASGIPPFRGTPDALWEKDVLEKGTERYHSQNPVAGWEWFLKVFGAARMAKPNPGHLALAEIEQKLLASGRQCLTITQNVDDLHTQAGTKNLVECHGNVHYMRCTRWGCVNSAPNGFIPWDTVAVAAFKAIPCLSTLPRCPCGHVLRPHVLWFDESYAGHVTYGSDRIDAAMAAMTVLVFIGTSFAVAGTDLMMTWAYQRAVPMFVIDPNVTQELDEMQYIKAPAEDYLPFLAADL